MKKYSTRKKILDLLSSRASITVSEMSRMLKLTKADVRYHLTRLADEGFVRQISPPQEHSTPGRPPSSFSLSTKNLPPIVARFLEGIGMILARPEIDSATREVILNSLIDSMLVNFHPHGSGSSRMNEIVKYLTSLGFSAKWEAGSTGPKIILYNNPASFYLNHPLIRYDVTEKLVRRLMDPSLS